MTGIRSIVVGLGFVIVLATAPSAVLYAQGPGGDEGPGGGLGRLIGAGGGVNYMMVLMAPAVQTELKLNDEQKTKLFDLTRQAQQKGRAMMQSVFQSGGNVQMMMELGRQLRQSNEAATAKILKTEQKERFDQIMLQIEGPLAVARPEIAAKLNMTSKQSQQVKGTVMQMLISVRQMVMANGGFNGLGAAGIPREAIHQLHAATRQLSRILDAKQKFSFNKMLGESFDLAKIDPELATPAVASTAPGAESGKTATTKAERARLRRKNAAAAKSDATDEAKANPDEAKAKP